VADIGGVDNTLAPIDSDGDGNPNYLDIDADNDGIPDTIEADLDVTADADGDQINDAYDIQVVVGADDNNDGVNDAISPTNTDADAAPDYLDLDSDNDSLLDVIEAGGADIDSNGIIDDAAANEGTLISPTNSDMVGAGDWRELDSDGNGTNDIVGTTFESEDGDDDGVVDDIADTDSDGIADVVDQLVGWGTAPDTDRDGILDAIDGTGDVDGDGLPNFQDVDSDNDGILDTIEAGPNPDSPVDTDGDGMQDYVDTDSDNDGILDELEGLDDRDNDGVPDYIDVDGFLETAVSGTGSTGWLLLFVLGGTVVMRLVMKGSRKSSVALLLVVGMALNLTAVHDARAEAAFDYRTDWDAAEFGSCWYGGLGYGYSYVAPEKEAQNFLLDKSEDNDSGLNFFIGKQFSAHWFAELKYADLGEAGITNRNPAIAALYPNAAITYKVPSLMAGYQWRVEEDLKTFAKIGLSSIANKAEGGPIPFEEQTSVQVAFGAGLRYDFPRNPWFLRGDVDFYDDDAWYAGVSLGLHFGSNPAKRAAPPPMVKKPAPAPAPKPAPAPAPPPPNPDLDGDGVLNERDRCPNTALGVIVDVRGCEIQAEIQLPDVRFETNSDRLRPGAENTLDDAAETLKRNPTLVTEVAGYTDSRGDDNYNRGLSERRAKTVRDYLLERGVSTNQMTWRGYGENDPIATNDTPDGRELNRRVVLRILQR